MKITSWILAAALGSACFAQEASKAPEPVHYFRLDFVLKELDAGKVINTRAYWISVSTEAGAHIRAGDQVQMKIPNSNSTTSSDIGVSIDCRPPKLLGDEIALSVRADISSLAPNESSDLRPIMRQNQWDSTAVVPLRKPTVIFSSDDPASKRQMQLEVTATPIKAGPGDVKVLPLNGK